MADTLSAPFPQRWLLDPGPYAPHIDAYRCHLFSLDYRPWTVLDHEQAARHFCCWLHVSDGRLTEVGETDVDRFRGHDCRCAGAHRRGSERPLYLSRVRSFLRFLAGTGVIEAAWERKPGTGSGDCGLARLASATQGTGRPHTGLLRTVAGETAATDRHGSGALRRSEPPFGVSGKMLLRRTT